MATRSRTADDSRLRSGTAAHPTLEETGNMSHWKPSLPVGRGAGAVRLLLAITLASFNACDSLLDVELPAEVTDLALEDPRSAGTLVNSVIALFECSYSSFAYWSMSHDDVGEQVTAGSAYQTTAPGGSCDQTDRSTVWYQDLQVSRALAAETYDRLANDWTAAEVPNREVYQAVLALYSAANVTLLGEFLCEVAFDAGPFMSPEQALLHGEEWIEIALGHIANTGDFEVADGIAPSAETMAYALRARSRMARKEYAGALEDASRVPAGFTAWVTRGQGEERRNKVAQFGLNFPDRPVLGVNDWWIGGPNPATDQPWPEVIPFTGYRHLGILPDGRAIWDDNQLPVRLEGPYRKEAEAGAVADRRVSNVERQLAAGIGLMPVPAKYLDEADGIPLVSWREMLLLRAEIEKGQTAIDLVNQLRDHHGLPQVTYVNPADEEQVLNMVYEERRREFYVEGGRWWATKIQHPDRFWFPRHQGRYPSLGYIPLGGVRLVMPGSEYDLNPNFTRDDRGTGCPPAERPVDF
ncbi:MAG: RagB/SusD family nutrient uptake outer membrane protein [Gemmatimonas sp.]|nr:RagB/SusD family nutrient uptake outer membrane protein [Gemmatimonas sp.]